MNTRACPARLAGVSVVLSILALGSGFASALENPAMVKDVRPGAASSNPEKFLPVGGKLFFVANDGTNGLEPWVSDGTLGGTSLLWDIWAGPNSGILLGCPTCNAVSTGGVVFFSAYNGANGSQLWRTDGTVAGTANVYPDATASTLTVVGSNILFAGGPLGSSLTYLFRSDGTTAGTARVRDNVLLSGTEMTAVNGTAYFPANGGSAGLELWRSDGSAAGTLLVKDLAPGSNSYPTRLTNVGGILYFTATDNTGYGLYKSDGTDPGTVLVKVLTIPADYTTPGQLIDVNGTAFLIATDAGHGPELWRSDGTTAGTGMVKDIYPGNIGGLDGSFLVAMGNSVYFAANDAVHGIELWKSDGTEAGTVMVKDIDPDPNAFSSSSPSALANVNGTLYFRANPGNPVGAQLWRSDGTASGTVQIAILNPNPGGNSLAYAFTGVAGSVYFGATDGTHGLELWAMLGGVIGVDPQDQTLPASVSLAQNFPNPFNPRTVIAFDLPAAARVNLRVYDVAGRLLRNLIVSTTFAEGHHEAAWDGRDESGTMAAAGIYMYRLEAGDQVESRPMVLVK